MTRTVGKAIKQINRTHELIRSGAVEVAHIPHDRPILGMVATLDPWYMANSFLGRQVLPACDVPVTVCSAREIEFLVNIPIPTGRGPLPAYLASPKGDRPRPGVVGDSRHLRVAPGHRRRAKGDHGGDAGWPHHEPSTREARRRIVEFIDRHLAAPGA
jgi:hypothetical protein